MSITPVGALLEIGSTLIQRLIPDKQKQAEALERLTKLQQEGDLEKLRLEVNLMLGQLEVNKQEAAHPSIFVAGWRPAIGWVCAISLFTYYVPYALAATSMWVHTSMVTGILQPRPDFSVADLMALIGGMLGISWQRTKEKLEEVDTKGVKWK